MKRVVGRWIKTIALVSTLVFLASSERITAQDMGACYMVTTSGRAISLGKLCGVTPSDKGVFRIPIKRRMGKTPVVDVTFNGHKTFEMIVDTGASITLITSNMANTLKLKPTGNMQAEIADGSQVKFSLSQVNSIAVGGAVVNNVEVAIAPKAGIGLLGHNFFDNYDVKILGNVIEFSRR
ncbi:MULTISPECIES: retropepsin-like aspartic protease family protein [Nostocales]|uniref:Aspartyl protease n=3 Tax=Nostocales TaxID=1161 RepID=A0A0C1QVX4_9CYAN|nr:retropepsin-like aspartic protease [Tolypothrix bouteillei]KAF3884443.1 aspartyl protease [Tolypothrix bouteillei VB521301]